MTENQVKWLFNKYSDKNISILEGVMGFYDAFHYIRLIDEEKVGGV